MPRLIDADALKELLSGELYDKQDIRDAEDKLWMLGNNSGIREARRLVDEAPTIDPVKYGHWEWNPNAYDWGLGAWVCSKCGHHDGDLPREQNPRIPVERYVYSNYCHCCGVKMNQNVTKD